MRKAAMGLCVLAFLAVALPCVAELQTITIGGDIHIRGNYASNTFARTPEVRWQQPFVFRRNIGDLFGPPLSGNVVSIYDWDKSGPNLKFVEQRTRLNVRADFTDNVTAFIELDNYNWWGEDFRSDYITGADFRAVTTDDVEVYQAYVEARQLWDTPLGIRIGRQELTFGTEWLLGNNSAAPSFTGLSFDAVRLMWEDADFRVDAWWSKLDERSPIEEDGDTDFYGIYATYTGIENLTFDAYYLLVRDAESLPQATNFGPVLEWLEDWYGEDKWDNTYLHTVGGRAGGVYGPVDFNAELAYQFGNADRVGRLFEPVPGIWANNAAKFNAIGATLEVGYTFDVQSRPRVFLGTSWYEGQDNRDLTFWQWLNPFYVPAASVSFNRLFSDRIYSGFVDLDREFSNAYIFRGGVSVNPTEKLTVLAAVTYFMADEAWDAPRHWRFGNVRIGVPWLSFWTQKNSNHLGTEALLFAWYRYNESLTFEAGWAHMFTGKGLEEGSYVDWNGLGFNGGSARDDGDYVYVGSKITF